MNKIILIKEEYYGLIGVANNYYSAVKWLTENGWLNSFDYIWVEEGDKWETIIDVFGENWKNLMLNEWDIDKFNEVLPQKFLLELTGIIGTEEE